MSMIRFPIATMIAISGPWVDETMDRPLLEGFPLTAPLVRYLAEAHNTLLNVNINTADLEKQAQALTRKAASLDELHDELYRALLAIFTGLAAVASGERRELLEKISATLFPEGLAGTQRTYLTESGNVELAVSRMTTEIQETLSNIPLEGKTLLQLFNEWVAAGRKLGEIERERARLTERNAGIQVTGRDVQKARHQWIRTVNALIALLDLDPETPADLITQVLQPLRAAEEKHARKKTISSDSDNSADEAPPLDTPATA